MKAHTQNTIIAIIEDSLVFNRILNRLDGLMNCYNPKKPEYEAMLMYNGIESFFILLKIGLHEEDLRDQILDAFYSVATDQDTPVKELAKIIFVDFLKILKEE